MGLSQISSSLAQRRGGHPPSPDVSSHHSLAQDKWHGADERRMLML